MWQRLFRAMFGRDFMRYGRKPICTVADLQSWSSFRSLSAAYVCPFAEILRLQTFLALSLSFNALRWISSSCYTFSQLLISPLMRAGRRQPEQLAARAVWPEPISKSPLSSRRPPQLASRNEIVARFSRRSSALSGRRIVPMTTLLSHHSCSTHISRTSKPQSATLPALRPFDLQLRTGSRKSLRSDLMARKRHLYQWPHRCSCGMLLVRFGGE